MARYGLFKYGAEKYGAETEEDALSWALEVDWDGDGVYDGYNEAITGGMSGLWVTRGRKFVIREGKDGFEMVRPGRFGAVLLNLTGRYDPYNASSPIYPYVAPGCNFRLRMRNNATGTLHDVMYGNITNIRPEGATVERVSIEGYDQAELLQETEVSTGILEDQGIDDAITQILTEAGWTGGSSLDSWTDVLEYWWASGTSAWNEITMLIDASLGRFFVAADGQAKYYSRLRSRTAVETLTEVDIQKGIETLQPWEVIRNNVNMTVNTRTLQATGELWRLVDKPLVKAGATFTIWAEYRYNDGRTPALNVVSPVATTDYTMNAQEDGGGADLTGNFTVTPTKFAETCMLEITNGGGTDGYITLLKIRGDALTTTPVMLNKQTGNANRKFNLNSDWLQDLNTANDILAILLNYLSGAQIYPTVRLRKQPALQFTPDLFDQVRLTFPSKSIDADYAVGYIEHKWVDARGQLVETKFGFEPPSMGATGRYWVFTAVVGVSTRFAG